MRKLILGLTAILFFACVEDRDIFIPNDSEGPHAFIKSLISSNSIVRILDKSKEHSVVSPSEVILDIQSDIVQYSEDDYVLNLIELNSFQDYILHNVNHHSAEGAINNLYGLFISFEGHEEEDLRMDVNKPIKIKIPSEKITENILVGKGQYESGALEWQYNRNAINNSLNYETWERIDSDGIVIQESGYTFEITHAGWYNLVSVTDGDFDSYYMCLEFNDDMFTNNNTISFALSNNKNYISPLQFNNQTSGYESCSSGLPFDQDSRYTVVSISEVNGKSYFGKSLVTINELFLTQEMLEIDEDQLILELSRL